MGVRFPEGQRPSFSEMQRASAMERETVEAQTQRPERALRPEATETAEATAPRDVQPAPSEQRNAIEQSAGNAGMQTPGSMIDLLA